MIIQFLKISGLKKYLFKRAVLRFFSKERGPENDHIVTIFGNKVSLDTRDLEQKYLAADCVREPENLVIYKAIAQGGLVNTFIDVGANCGHVAASVLASYDNLILIEPNPKLAKLLREIFHSNKKVIIEECAIVGDKQCHEISLTVPKTSSGLATLGETKFSEKHSEFDCFTVKAKMLDDVLSGVNPAKCYIKIDVEGFELEIIKAGLKTIREFRPLIGFEALSKDAALACAKQFENYMFYCARFDFLEQHGALSKSMLNIARATIFGGNIVILKLGKDMETDLENFSQVYAVPIEKSELFESLLSNYCDKEKHSINLANLRTWS